MEFGLGRVVFGVGEMRVGVEAGVGVRITVRERRIGVGIGAGESWC